MAVSIQFISNEARFQVLPFLSAVRVYFRSLCEANLRPTSGAVRRDGGEEARVAEKHFGRLDSTGP